MRLFIDSNIRRGSTETATTSNPAGAKTYAKPKHNGVEAALEKMPGDAKLRLQPQFRDGKDRTIRADLEPSFKQFSVTSSEEEEEAAQ